MTKVRRIVRAADGTTRVKFRRGPYQTDAQERGREIIVTLEPQTCVVRLKGTRTSLSLPWTLVFLKAAEMQRRFLDKEKAAARKVRKVARGRLGR